MDGSDQTESILPYVSHLAKGLNIPVLLLSVVNPDGLDIPEKGFGVGPWESALRNRLPQIAKRIEDDGVKVEHIIRYGRASEEIVRTAEIEGCDIIAMSTSGRGLLGRIMLGSVTYHVVHSSPVPTLTIAPEKSRKYAEEGVKISRIPVPLDGSKLAETALPYAEHLAEHLSAELLLVQVVSISNMYPSLITASASNEIAEQMKSEAEGYLEGVANRIRAKGLSVSWRVLEGAPAPQIVDLARETSEDLIAMTTHGRSGFRAGLLGSVAISVIQHSGDPVLVIPPPRP